MKNFVAHGAILTIANSTGAEIASGAGVLIGSIFGVAGNTIADGDSGPVQVEGVFDLTKQASQAWSVGDVIYWDATNSVATKTATDNTKIGVAIMAVAGGAGDTIGRVRLNGAFG